MWIDNEYNRSKSRLNPLFTLSSSLVSYSDTQAPSSPVAARADISSQFSAHSSPLVHEVVGSTVFDEQTASCYSSRLRERGRWSWLDVLGSPTTITENRTNDRLWFLALEITQQNRPVIKLPTRRLAVLSSRFHCALAPFVPDARTRANEWRGKPPLRFALFVTWHPREIPGTTKPDFLQICTLQHARRAPYIPPRSSVTANNRYPLFFRLIPVTLPDHWLFVESSSVLRIPFVL